MSELRSINTDLAIDAFRAAEQKKYQLELKEYLLEKALAQNVNMARYAEETEKIRAKYERDRMLAASRGALPRRDIPDYIPE